MGCARAAYSRARAQCAGCLAGFLRRRIRDARWSNAAGRIPTHVSQAHFAVAGQPGEGECAAGVRRQIRPCPRMGAGCARCYWQEAERCLAGNPGMIAYLRRCGGLLHDVVTGRVNALETLFPDGSFDLAESLYERSAEAQYGNAIVAAAISAAARGWGR